MVTRRGFLQGLLAVGAGLVLAEQIPTRLIFDLAPQSYKHIDLDDMNAMFKKIYGDYVDNLYNTPDLILLGNQQYNYLLNKIMYSDGTGFVGKQVAVPIEISGIKSLGDIDETIDSRRWKSSSGDTRRTKRGSWLTTRTQSIFA